MLHWKVFGFPYFRNWIRVSAILFSHSEAELHERTQWGNKQTSTVDGRTPHTSMWSCQVYLRKKKPHVLSLEQSQKKDERNKGKEHRVIPDKAWRKAGVQCCVNGRNIYLILYFTLKPLSACSHAGELALLGCSQHMKAGCWRSMVRV